MTSTDQTLGQLSHDPRVLLGTRPSNIHPRVSQAMISPILGCLDPKFLMIMDETMALLRHLFQTENEMTITLPGTGMARMEPDDEIIVGIHGFFGQRRADIFFANPNYAGGGT